jgi:ribose transport system ATP-binding protein
VEEMSNLGRPALLEMTNICKRFPGVQALSAVNFDLQQGEVHLLLGENGAGKSTLIKILSGVYRPDEGHIYINGKMVAIQDPNHAQQLAIATIYQDFALIPHLSVAQNLFLNREIRYQRINFILNNKKMDEMCIALLDRLEIPLRPQQLISSLNTAEKQLVEIARALSTDSQILIMDEPTSTLTSKEIDRLFMMVHQLKSRGVGIIYISHRLEEALGIGDRATVLRDGRQVKTTNVKDTDIDEIIRYMVGRDIADRYPKRNLRPKEEILRIENLTNPPFCKNVHFSLRKGEILGLAGLLGSGKELVLRYVSGVEIPQKMSLTVSGRAVRVASSRDAINMGITYLPSDRKEEGCVLRLDVKKNITLAAVRLLARLGFVRTGRENAIAGEYVNDLNIRPPRLGILVEYLSGGNQQKVVIAKSLCCKPSIMLFDEPTQGIDIGAKVEIYHLISELATKGCGIIMASSELDELMGMCDRIIAMYAGSMVEEFTRDEFDEEDLLAAIFGKNTEGELVLKGTGSER